METVASDIDPAAVETGLPGAAGRRRRTPAAAGDRPHQPQSGPGLGAPRTRFTARARTGGPGDGAGVDPPPGHLQQRAAAGGAEFMANAGRWAIVEFVPKGDSQVKRLLATRKDIFNKYTEEGFEEAFALFFELEQKVPIPGSQRTLYLFKRRD